VGDVPVTATDQVNFYSQHTTADPTRRSYSIGEQAASTVVRMAGESGTVSVDIETMGLEELAFKVKVMIVSTDRHACVLDERSPIHRRAFYDALRAARKLVFHNSSFDVPPLVVSGLMHIDDISKVFDTLVCARMALTGFAARRGLGDLEKRYLGGSLRSETKDRFGDWAKVNGLSKSKAFAVAGYDHPVYQMYAGWDGILTSMVLPHVLADAREQLTDHPFGRYGADTDTAEYLIEREQRVNRAMLRRSARGLVVDPGRIDREQDRLREQMNTLADELTEFDVLDPSNRNQLAASLDQAGALGEDYPRTATGKISTAKENLDAVDHPAVVAFRGHDQRRRLFTYLEHARLVAERTDGRVHPQCNVLHARTGRMSYSNPEIHQFIADARTVIERDPEHSGLVSIDWSSIEPVTVANLAGDREAIERFESGIKLYDVVSASAGVAYKTAKIVLLAALYGQGIRSLATKLGLSGDGALEQAKALQAQVFEAMPMTRRFIGWSTAWSEEVGKTWTLSGRIVDVDREVGYKGTNYSVQGSAYDVLAESIVAIDDAGMSDGLYLAMHDELIIAEEIAHDVRVIMEKPPDKLVELSGRVPKLRTDAAFLGDRWNDADNCPTWPTT
jgi:DNA polymerase family A/3'-5' exonuclease